jgi:hypothetical protein
MSEADAAAAGDPAGTRALVAHRDPGQLASARAVAVLQDVMPGVGISRRQVRALLGPAVTGAILRRGLTPDDIMAPAPEIVAPAMAAMSYSPLRAEFANLVASAMSRRDAAAVLPAYVEVLKQLSADEVALLAAAPQLGRALPIGDLMYAHSSGRMLAAHRNIVPASFAAHCQIRGNIPQYIDNLVRLNLVNRQLGAEGHDQDYNDLLNQAFVAAAVKARPPRSKAALERGVLGLTDFGARFRAACLD